MDTGLLGPNNAKRSPDFAKGTPLMIDGTLYIRSRYSTVAAIDASTGDEL